MNKYNDQYYIAVEPFGAEQPYVIADKITSTRLDHHQKLPLGQAPLTFYNRNKEQDRAKGNKWPVTPVLETGGDFLVNDIIREQISHYDIDGLQLYPAVFIDDDDVIHPNYWFLNFYKTFSYWDKKQSEVICIDGYLAEIDKYSLDPEKLGAITEQSRLIFKMGGVTDPYIFIHQTLVSFLMVNNCNGIRFFKTTDFEEGDQFRKRAKYLQV